MLDLFVMEANYFAHEALQGTTFAIMKPTIQPKIATGNHSIDCALSGKPETSSEPITERIDTIVTKTRGSPFANFGNGIAKLTNNNNIAVIEIG